MNAQMWEHAAVEFDDGIVCLFEKPLWTDSNHWDVMGTAGRLAGNELVLYGSEAQPFGREVAVRHPTQEAYVEVDGGRLLSEVRVDTDPHITWENRFLEYGIGDHDDVAKASLLQGMHRAATEGRAPLYGAANARRDMEICLAVWESSRRGNQWVDLPLGDEPMDLERRILEEYISWYGHDPVEETEALLSAEFRHRSVWWAAAQWL